MGPISVLGLFARVLLVAAVILALADFDWRLILFLFLSGIGGWGLASYLERVPLDETYERAIQKHRKMHEAREASVSMFSPAFTASMVVSFLLFASLSIYLDTFWPMSVWFGAAVCWGLFKQHKHQQQIDQVWQSFANEMGWECRADKPTAKGARTVLQGEKSLRRFELCYALSSRLSSSQRQLVFAKTWTSEDVSNQLDFHLQRGNPESDPEAVAQELMQSNLFIDDFQILSQGSLSLVSGQIEFVLDRSPRRAMELRYYIDLLERLANRIEALDKERRERLAEQVRTS